MIKLAGTGLDGLVGSRLVELFDSTFNITNASLKTGVDLTKPNQIIQFVTETNPDFMIHCAAFTDVNAAYQQRGDKQGSCYQVNVVGTANLAQACAQANIPLIHLSTDYVFDGTKNGSYTETDPPHALEWYGETKALAETAIAKSGATAMILRLAFPYRATYAAKLDLIAKLRAGLNDGQLYPQFSDTLITPTFIDDLAEAIKLAIANFQPGIFHTVGSQSLSNFELAKLVARVFDLNKTIIKPGSLTEYLKTSERPFHRQLKLSNQKFTKQYNFHFATVEEGLNRVKVQLNSNT